MNLKTIIKSELLFESLEDRLKSAYRKWCKKMKLKDQEILDDIEDADGFPEELGQYNSDFLDYNSEIYQKATELYDKGDYEGIHNLIANDLCRDVWIDRQFKDWASYRNLTKSSDIFQYKSERELEKELRDAKEKSFTKKLKKASAGEDFDKIWENDDMLIVVPKSHVGACKFGQGTKWCTASKTNNYFDSYYKKGILYRVLQKNDNYKELFSNLEGLDKRDIENLSKVSINLRRKENSMSMVDKVDYAYGDKATSEFLNSLPYEGYKAIKNYQSLNEQSIKKIIRETIEDFDWLSNYEFDTDKVKVGDKFKVVGGYDWFEVDRIKWNETIPELSRVYIKNPDEGWENEFYIKDIIKSLNRGRNSNDPNDLEKIENKEIKESEDFDWVKETNPIQCKDLKGYYFYYLNDTRKFIIDDVFIKNPRGYGKGDDLKIHYTWWNAHSDDYDWNQMECDKFIHRVKTGDYTLYDKNGVEVNPRDLAYTDDTFDDDERKEIWEQDESGDFDWVKDTLSNHDIAQNIVDKTNMWMVGDDLRVNLPFMPYGKGYSAKQLFKTFSLLRDKNPTIMFLEYLLYKYGIGNFPTKPFTPYKPNPKAQDIWFRYKNLITEKVLDNLKDKPINESDDFDWVKDIKPTNPIDDFLMKKFEEKMVGYLTMDGGDGDIISREWATVEAFLHELEKLKENRFVNFLSRILLQSHVERPYPHVLEAIESYGFDVNKSEETKRLYKKFQSYNSLGSKIKRTLKKAFIREDDFGWVNDRPQPSEGVVKLVIHLPNVVLEYDVDFKNVEQFLSLVQDYAIEAVEGYMMPIDRIGLNGWVVLNRYPSETQELKDGLNKLKKKVNSYL